VRNFVIGFGTGLTLTLAGFVWGGYRLYQARKGREAKRVLERKRKKLERLRRQQQARWVAGRLGYLEGFQECYDWLVGEPGGGEGSEEAAQPEDPAERAMWEHRRREED